MHFEPYTYLIGWSTLDRWYYGVQYSKTAHPNNLWTVYFTSSKIIQTMRKQFGEPDIIKIRRLFKSKEDALKWEEKVLTRLDVCHNPKWINESMEENSVIEKDPPKVRHGLET